MPGFREKTRDEKLVEFVRYVEREAGGVTLTRDAEKAPGLALKKIHHWASELLRELKLGPIDTDSEV